jgi:tripartite-type tricarboxylate transporter receptor subunit TctC
MTSFPRRLSQIVFAGLTLVLQTGLSAAHAETFPDHTVKIIVGQGPGTTSDILARLVAAKLQEIWSIPVVIEGHSGAAGTIAASMVAKSPPDGYTLLLASSANLAMAAVTVDSLPYDPAKDFAPIGRIAKIPWALGARAKLPARTIAELVSYSKAHPGRLKGGSTGPGSAAAFGIDMLNRETGTDILNVPYRTVAASIQAVLSEEVDMVFTDASLLSQHLKAGTLQLLGAAGSKRLRAFPEVPTMVEQGVGGIVLEPWYGLAAPAATPPPILAKLGQALHKALRTADLREPMLSFGYEPIDEAPADFAAAIAADIARFSASARNAAMTPAH